MPWLIVAAIVLTGCAVWRLLTASSGGAGSWGRIRRDGIIRIGYAIEAPFAFLGAQGEPTGLEIEVARGVAAALDIRRVEWVQTDFARLIPELAEGRFDAVAAGMFITPERAKAVLFSEPTFRVRQALLVRAGNPRGLHAYEDLAAKEGAKIAVLLGSIEEQILRGMGLAEPRVLIVPDALTGRIAVETGLADGLALSLPTVRYMARQQMLGLTESAQPFAQPSRPGGRLTGFGAVVFRKTEDALRQAWNRGLAGFIGSAEHRRLLSLFGLEDEDLPGGVTTATILSPGAQ